MQNKMSRKQRTDSVSYVEMRGPGARGLKVTCMENQLKAVMMEVISDKNDLLLV